MPCHAPFTHKVPLKSIPAKLDSNTILCRDGNFLCSSQISHYLRSVKSGMNTGNFNADNFTHLAAWIAGATMILWSIEVRDSGQLDVEMHCASADYDKTAVLFGLATVKRPLHWPITSQCENGHIFIAPKTILRLQSASLTPRILCLLLWPFYISTVPAMKTTTSNQHWGFITKN